MEKVILPTFQVERIEVQENGIARVFFHPGVRARDIFIDWSRKDHDTIHTRHAYFRPSPYLTLPPHTCREPHTTNQESVFMRVSSADSLKQQLEMTQEQHGVRPTDFVKVTHSTGSYSSGLRSGALLLGGLLLMWM